MRQWWRDLTNTWYYLRRTIRVVHGKAQIIPAKRTRGLWDRLTPEQKAAALAYRGPEAHGDPDLARRSP